MTNEVAPEPKVGSSPTSRPAMTAAHSPQTARQRTAELELQVESLQQALQSRSVISQAVGMVMLAMPASAATAFDVLAYISQHTNTKLHTLAQSICGHVAGGAGLPPEVADLLAQAVHQPRDADWIERQRSQPRVVPAGSAEPGFRGAGGRSPT